MGRIILTSLDYLKPDLSQPLASPELLKDIEDDDPSRPSDATNTSEKVQPAKKKAQPLVGFQHFQVSRCAKLKWKEIVNIFHLESQEDNGRNVQ